MTKFLLATAAIFCLLAVPASASESFDLSKLTAATQADLAAAKADADAHGDAFASMCYAGVSDYITAHPLPAITTPVGVASAFQVARDGVKFVQAGAAQGVVPPELVQACGPLALDVQNDLGKAVGNFAFLGIKF
jgi:hypothetical protein